MAQFRSASREGNFSANQLVVPDTTNKIKAASERYLRGMDKTQQALDKQRRIFLESQKAAQQLQRQGAEYAFKVEDQASTAKAKRSAEMWQRQLAAKEAEDKYKVDTFGALANFSKTAFNITTDIMKANKDNQLRAINQIAFEQGYSYEDVITAASVDSSISQAEWMRTNTVRDMLASGKSPEYAKVMYEHMIKGGGYRNYMNAKDVLIRQGRIDAGNIMMIAANKDIPIEERRKQIATIEAQQRAALSINGEIPNAKILESAYNPTIRSTLDKSEEILMGATLEELEEMNRVDTAVNVNNLAFPAGGGFFPEAVYAQVSGDPRPQAIDDATKILVSGRQLSMEQIAAIKEARFEKNGKMITLQEGGYVNALSMLDNEYTRAKEATKERITLEEKENALVQQQWWMENAQQMIDDDRYTKAEHESLIAQADARFGMFRDRSMDKNLENYTVAKQLRPLIIEDLERRALDGSLTKKYMMESKIPIDIQDRFSQYADRSDQVKASPEYKNVEAKIKQRVEQAIAGTTEFKLVEGRFQSDQAQWFLGEQVKKYKRDYFEAMLGGADEAALESILDKAAFETATYLQDGKNYKLGEGLNAYNKHMTDQRKNQLRAAQAITSLNTLLEDDGRRKDPREWIKQLGEPPLIEAAQELRTTGSSVLLEEIAGRLKKTPIEVVNELATVSEGIDLIVTPANYQYMLDNFTPVQRFNFTSDLVTGEQRLREVRRQMGDLSEQPRRASFQFSQNPAQGRWVELAQQAGFTPEEAVIMGQIVMAESGGDAQIDTVKSGLDPNKENEYSIGGPQINVAVHQDKLAARGFTEEDMRDPLKAMIIAKDVYDQQGFEAWTTYNEGLHLNFNQASGGPRSHTGALTYKDNKQAYRSAGKAFKDAGFRVGEHSDFDKVDPVHSKNSYHYHDEAFDITDWTGGNAPGAREASIAKTGRLQRLIESLDLFYEVIGPLSNDPDHAAHLHLGGLKRPMTAEDIKRIKSLK